MLLQKSLDQPALACRIVNVGSPAASRSGSPAEAAWAQTARPLDHFVERGGFPEPFLTPDPGDARRWRRLYLDGLIREDILSFDAIRDLRAMNLLVELLRVRVGSPLSYQSLAEDLAVAPNTVRKYLDVLDALCITFRVYPHQRSIARALSQRPKVYFFDTGLVTQSPGAQEWLEREDFQL